MPFELLRQARRAIQLSSPRLPSSETADRWLIGLRWGAIGGMLATVLVARRLVPGLALGPLLGVLGGIVALNVGWLLAARALRSGSERPPLVSAQIAVDVVAVTAMLWFSGGVQNPFAAFMVFQIVLAGLLCTGRVSVAVTLLAVASAGILYYAPPLPLDTAPLGADRVLHVGGLVSLASLSAFLGFFVLVYLQRVAELRAESARNERLAMLGKLVGGMSHELNTPLSTILVASKDLVEVAKQADTPERDVAQLSGTIAAEAQRASDIIGLMRGHIRPDLMREGIDVSAFVAEWAGKELDRLRFTGERVVRADRPVAANIIKAALGQVLTNVITNAVEATGRVPTPRIEITVTRRTGGVDVAVRDNGPGIDAELLAQIGEPFQTTKADRGGMGLGLYVSTVLAQKLGGFLHVESDGRGTLVVLRLREGR